MISFDAEESFQCLLDKYAKYSATHLADVDSWLVGDSHGYRQHNMINIYNTDIDRDCVVCGAGVVGNEDLKRRIEGKMKK